MTKSLWVVYGVTVAVGVALSAFGASKSVMDGYAVVAGAVVVVGLIVRFVRGVRITNRKP